jgi:hypothetical protein
MKLLVFKLYRNCISIWGFGLIVSLSCCKKLVVVDPPINSITQENAYNNDVTAAAVLTGLYAQISNANGTSYGLPSISLVAGLSADEFGLWSGAEATRFAYFSNSLFAPTSLSINAAGHELWNNCYPLIYVCNSAIEGLNDSKFVSPSIKKQLLGEAKFVRAFIYFNLVNLYGELPLATSTDPEINRLLFRSSVVDVYNLIVKDLQEAKELLSDVYLNATLQPYLTGTPERIRPTKWSAIALLARVYLYNKDYTNAEKEASNIINNSSLFKLSPLADVFLKNSTEAIWQLQPVTAGWNTEDARMFNLAAVPEGFSSTKCVYLSSRLLSAFESGDDRDSIWTGNYLINGTVFYYPNKYRQGSQDANITSAAQMIEYRMVLRLGELFLIRAEARAQQNKISESIADLNLLRNRARAIPTLNIPNPLPDIPGTISQAQLLNQILHERQVELFSEWGHRWFDLKRTGNVNAVMDTVTIQKGGIWNSTDQLYPIPYSDIVSNPNLVGHQNPGY